MPLELIVGPLNSGRTGAILDRFEVSLERDPVLVVPTADDTERFERELGGRARTRLGGTVTTFPGLFGAVAERLSQPGEPALDRLQRTWLMAEAASEARLRILRSSAAHPGFAPALEGLVSELQSEGLTAADLRSLAAELDDGAYELEIAELFAAYERLRDAAGRVDQHQLAAAATAALRADPSAWKERPTLLYGFDDLSREQIELVAALAAAGPVTVAVTFEDRAALTARADLRGTLVDELGGRVVEAPLPSAANTPSPTLFHLERNLFEPRPDRLEPADGALELLSAAGERGEAELIGRRIAELLAAGCEPDDVAIAVRSPSRQAPTLARVIAGMGIPVAAEARIPLTATATGSTLLRLLAIRSPDGTAADVVAYLRGPARAHPGSVDWLEREVFRGRMLTAPEALEAWERRGHTIWQLDELDRCEGDATATADVVARIAAGIAELPFERQGAVPGAGDAIELRAAAELRAALESLAALAPDAFTGSGLARALELVEVPLWRGPTEGRVRILSPYRLRAGRIEHLFVAGLTDGSFPAPTAGDPLLGESRRGELGLRSRQDPADEERYLFYTCVSRPLRGLHLCWTDSDHAGGPVARSPFVEEVRAVLEPEAAPDPADDPLERRLTTRLGIGEVVGRAELASTPRALARAIAALDEESGARTLEALALPRVIRDEVGAAVAGARAACAAAALPGPLTNPTVLAALAEPRPYGASTLEEYDTCSYRWFVGHELDPQSIEPDAEPLESGAIVHDALEHLYAEPPAGSRPEPDTLPAWTEAARAAVRTAAAERGWREDDAGARISLARFDAVIARFLERDAATGGPLQPRPELLEASFGSGEEARWPAADLGGWTLHGRIDRIDVSADGRALIRDYKLSREVPTGKQLLARGKLQLPLYMKALAGMGLEPIGALYHPLAATDKDRPRGILAKEHKGSLIPGETAAHVGTDFLDDEELEEFLEQAVKRASEIVAGIEAGRVKRDPRDGVCPRWCALGPICRMERGTVEAEEEEDELR